jgi:hypothetical protein
MRTGGGGWAVRALVGALAVLLPAAGWAAVTVGPEPAPTGMAGATGIGGASFLDEELPAPAPASTLAPATTTSTIRPATSTTKPPATSTTKAPATKPSGPATTTTTVDLPAFMKTMPNPPGYLPAATSWEAKADGVSVRMRIEPTTPVAGQPVRILLDYTGVNACCIVELHFGDGSPQFLANHDPPCAAGGTLSPGAHSTVVTHVYDAPRPYRALLKVLDGDLCTLPRSPEQADLNLLHHVELFACIAVGPGTPMTPGCDPLPPYGPYFPQ